MPANTDAKPKRSAATRTPSRGERSHDARELLIPDSSGHFPAALKTGDPDAWNITNAAAYLDRGWQPDDLPANSELIITPEMMRVAAGMPSALRPGRRAPMAVSGPFGSGKTTLLATLTAVSDVNCAVVDLTHTRSTKKQWQLIGHAVTGGELAGTASQIQDHTRDYLHLHPTLLIVDEAQNLTSDALLQLRWLFSHRYNQFAILLAGTHLFDHLDDHPAVGTKITRRTELAHPDTDTIIDLVRRHNPFLAATDRHLLVQVDETYARGSWRMWTHLLKTLGDDWGHKDGAFTADDLNDAILSITATEGIISDDPAVTQNRAGNPARPDSRNRDVTVVAPRPASNPARASRSRRNGAPVPRRGVRPAGTRATGRRRG